jgi:hypothetical protein
MSTGWLKDCSVYHDPRIRTRPASVAPRLTIGRWPGLIEEVCQGNSKCAALELTGACCPTVDNIFLACCDVVPDKCLEGDSSDGSE